MLCLNARFFINCEKVAKATEACVGKIKNKRFATVWDRYIALTTYLKVRVKSNRLVIKYDRNDRSLMR